MTRPENTGYDFDRILETLGGKTYELIDTTGMSGADRWKIYSEQAVSAAGNRYRVARAFGSNRHPGQDFGDEVPALLLYSTETDLYPVDVFPHEQRNGDIVTIADHLAIS